MEYVSFTDISNRILEEIARSLSWIDDGQIDLLTEEICRAGAIYLDGKGRSSFPAASFAMRLGQMGMTAYMTNGFTTPPIRRGDLLFICSGSGETEDLLCHAKTAKKQGARIVLLTAAVESSLGEYADLCIRLQARTKWQKDFATIQPMGSVFEQGTQVFLDALIIRLMDQKQITNEEMQALHNNLE